MMLTQTTLSVGNGRIKAEQHGWNTDAEMSFPVNKCTQHTRAQHAASPQAVLTVQAHRAFLLEVTAAVS